MIEIDDLDGAREVLIGKVPDPLGSVAYDDFLCRAAPATVPGFQIDALTKLLGRLDGSRIGSRIRIANRVAFFIPGRLGEDASHFDLPRMSWLTVGFALATLGFFLHHRHAGPVHLHTQNRNGLADDDGQVQLAALWISRCSPVAMSAPIASAVRSTDLAVTSRPARTFDPLAAVIEGRLLTHQSLHAAHARRAVAVFNIELAVGGELAVRDNADTDTEGRDSSTSPSAVRSRRERRSR